MKLHQALATSLALAALGVGFVAPGVAQPLSGPPASPDYKYSTTPMPPGIAAPDTLETLAPEPLMVHIGHGRLAKDVPLANRVRSGRKQP
jgi:hypothetical protein